MFPMTIRFRSRSLIRLSIAPAFPSNPLSSIEEWRKWVKEFVDWYHAEPHSAIKFVTPFHRHEGKDRWILAEENWSTKMRRLLILFAGQDQLGIGIRSKRLS